MKNEEFASKVVEELKKCYPDKDIEYRKVIKNNNTIFHGITILDKVEGISAGPTIYIDTYLNERREFNQASIDAAVNYVIRAYEQEKDNIISLAKINDIFNDFNKVKEGLFCCLINYDKNEEQLQTIPHRKFLDLAIVYKIKVDSVEAGEMTALINNYIMEKWGITEQELYNIAIINTPKLYKFEATTIWDAMERLAKKTCIKDLSMPDYDVIEEYMFIVSNNIHLNGCHVMLYSDYLRKLLTENNAKRAYVIPSSIHEILLIFDDLTRDNNNPLDILQMVQAVNKEQLVDEEVLSDTVYEITLEDDISIAASARPWKGRWDY